MICLLFICHEPLAQSAGGCLRRAAGSPLIEAFYEFHLKQVLDFTPPRGI